MPTISMFYGIIVRMYCSPGEHNPPHIHVYYQDDNAIVSIPDGEILSGEIPNRKLRLVQAWVELHSEELMANWKLVTNGELPFKVDPLR
jgi:hypothetical protein